VSVVCFRVGLLVKVVDVVSECSLFSRWFVG